MQGINCLETVYAWFSSYGTNFFSHLVNCVLCHSLQFLHGSSCIIPIKLLLRMTSAGSQGKSVDAHIVFESEEIKKRPKHNFLFHKKCNINISKVVVPILHICSTIFLFHKECKLVVPILHICMLHFA
jgi:hypothetical protein